MIKNIIYAFRSLFRKGNNNTIKILSMGIGLAVGLLLISKIYFQLSFDDFYPGKEYIYQVQTKIQTANKAPYLHGSVSGGVLPALKASIPAIEAAARFTELSDGEALMVTADKNSYMARCVLADSSLFDVLPRTMLIGDARQILAKPMRAVVSQTLAKKMGGIDRAIGQLVEWESYPGRQVVIEGVFEDFPENSHVSFDAAVSLNSIAHFKWDGRDNWVGNDIYSAYVRLRPGTAPESLRPAMHQVLARNVNLEELKKEGFSLGYELVPLQQLSSSPGVRRMLAILGLLAFALLLSAVMNYALIVISSLVNRTKEVAVHKCYGASARNLSALILSETFVHLLLSLVVAAGLILLFRNTVETVFYTSLGGLFTGRALILLGGVSLLIFLFASWIPVSLFTRLPVAAAFRHFKESRRSWKLALLFVQFTAVMFLTALLVFVGRQYRAMTHDNPGYAYEKLLYLPTKGAGESRQAIYAELGRLPEIERLSSCDEIPLYSPSGNMVFVPHRDESLFTAADLYSVGENYFDVMEIPLVAGIPFRGDGSDGNNVMVDRSFAEKASRLMQWPDGAVGKQIRLTEHSRQSDDYFTIIGVYENFRVGTIGQEDSRPTMLFYSRRPCVNLLIKLRQADAKSIARVNEALKQIVPGKERAAVVYKTLLISQYDDSRRFRNIVMAGVCVTLAIALMGLIGYIKDELNRRSSEIAIRKINGATFVQIQQLLARDILRIALPALVVGALASVPTALKWQEAFTEKVGLSPQTFLLCGMAVLTAILLVIAISSFRIARRNPVENLRNN